MLHSRPHHTLAAGRVLLHARRVGMWVSPLLVLGLAVPLWACLPLLLLLLVSPAVGQSSFQLSVNPLITNAQCGNAYDTAINPVNGELYAACSVTTTVGSVQAMAGGLSAAPLTTQSNCPQPIAVTANSQTNSVYATCYGTIGSFTSATSNLGGSITATTLFNPVAPLLDSSNNLYVSDMSNNRVLYFPFGSPTPTRVYGQGGVFTTGTANNGGISSNSLYYPYGMQLDVQNNLYIADYVNNRVLMFPPGVTTASRVWGQSGLFTTNTANYNGLSANSLYYALDVAVDNALNVYVADYYNNRVLYYPAGTTTATRVYGQAGSFTVSTANNGGLSANSLYQPISVELDAAGNLYVTDITNNRVLFYLAGSTTAVRVYGQGGLFNSATSNYGGISANSLAGPLGLFVDPSNNLYLADQSNNRVLFFPNGTTTATRVWGQFNVFTTNVAANGGLSANSMTNPYWAVLDSLGNLYVTEYPNNRLTVYQPGLTTASLVMGQGINAGGVLSPVGSQVTSGPVPNFQLSGGNTNGGPNAASMSSAIGVALDSFGGMYVSDNGNNRVLYYPSGSTTATRVYGQSGSFTTVTSNTGGITANSLFSPYGLNVDNQNNLYVADYQNNRVLMFVGTSTTPTRVWGQLGSYTTNTANNGGVTGERKRERQTDRQTEKQESPETEDTATTLAQLGLVPPANVPPLRWLLPCVCLSSEFVVLSSFRGPRFQLRCLHLRLSQSSHIVLSGGHHHSDTSLWGN